MLIKLNIKGVLDSVDYVSALMRSCTREGKSRAVKSTVLHHLTGGTIKHYTRFKGEVSNEIALYATVVSSAKEGAACFLSIKSLVNGRPVVLCNSDSLLETKVAKSLTEFPSGKAHSFRGGSKKLREEFSHLQHLPSLWTRSYFVSTAGNVSSETIKRYVEQQKTRGCHRVSDADSQH
jgi:hypothetical protein